jgi:5-methylcytosine-specific restriction endonuclease McrA
MPYKDPEAQKAYWKARYRKNRKTDLKRARAWYQANKTASKERLRTYRVLRRAAYLQMKQSLGGCARCGYNENAVALEFDHIDPTTKVAAVSTLALRNKRTLAEEIQKCQLLCANCHRIKTLDSERF